MVKVRFAITDTISLLTHACVRERFKVVLDKFILYTHERVCVLVLDRFRHM